jgi:hypothetical protein
MTKLEEDLFNFHNKLVEDQQRMLDIARETNFSLWNALLSFNAIMITVFTGFLALTHTTNKTILFIIIFISIFSALFLIFNFKANQHFYYKKGIDFFERLDRIANMNDFEQQKYNELELKKASKGKQIMAWFENISIILIVFELLMIVIFIFQY